MSWQTRQLGIADRQPRGAALPVPEKPVVPDTTPTRSFGFQSGAGTNPQVAGRDAEVAANTVGVGEVGGFKTEGAPMPVEVVRGMKTTYTNPAPESGDGGYNPTPAQNTAEYATAPAARMAWNRGQADIEAAAADARGVTDPGIAARHGTWKAPGTALAEVVASKEGPGATQERTEKSKLFQLAQDEKSRTEKLAQQKEDVAEFNRQLQSSAFATHTPGKGLEFKPETEDLAKDAKAAENYAREFGWKEGLQHLQERQTLRKYLMSQTKYTPDTNWHSVLDDLAANPTEWKKAVKMARDFGTNYSPPRSPGVLETTGKVFGGMIPTVQNPF
jgi:hypothetical protein